MIIAYGNQNSLVTIYDYTAMEYVLAYATMYIPKFVKDTIPEFKDLDLKDFDRGVKIQIELYDDLYRSRGKNMLAQFSHESVADGKTLAGCTMSADRYLHRICISLGGSGVYKKGGPIVKGPMYVSNIMETFVHEFIHVLQTFSGRSVQNLDSSCTFDGVKYTYAELQYREAPWEVEAFGYMKPITDKIYELFNELILKNDKNEHELFNFLEILTNREDEYVKNLRPMIEHDPNGKALDNPA